MKKTVIFALCFAMPLHCWFGRRAQHPLNRPQENPPLFSLLQNNPRIRNASQVVFLGILIAYGRLLNKPYEKKHFALSQALSAENIIAHPIKCIDDGLIGHPGSGHLQPYGIMGSSWALIPKIDKTLIAVDNAQRKTQAWVQWLQKNVRALDDQSTMERWWRQLSNWAHN